MSKATSSHQRWIVGLAHGVGKPITSGRRPSAYIIIPLPLHPHLSPVKTFDMSTTGVTGAYTPSELAKMTVPQLKAICKEKKISGYSKLGKQALLQKLKESGSCSGSSGGLCTSGSIHSLAKRVFPRVPDHLSSCQGSRRPSELQAVPDSQRSRVPSSVIPNPTLDTDLPVTLSSSFAARESSLVETTPSSVTHGGSTGEKHSHYRLVTANGTSLSSDSLPLQHILSYSALGNETDEAVTIANASACMHQDNNSKRKVTHLNIDPMPRPPKRARMLPPSELPLLLETTSAPSSALAPSRKFKPLVVTKRVLSNVTSGNAQIVPLPDSPEFDNGSLTTTLEPSLMSIENIVATVPQLSPITSPPNLSQRKRVQRWAVILSGLSDQQRAVCVFVSRAFRYAGTLEHPGPMFRLSRPCDIVYLSASCILSRDYAGCRLQEDILNRYSQAMTNMWPYLRSRETEVAQRRETFQLSFAWRFLQKLGLPDPIAAHMWTSPNDPKQLLIAVRRVVCPYVNGAIWTLTAL